MDPITPAVFGALLSNRVVKDVETTEGDDCNLHTVALLLDNETVLQITIDSHPNSPEKPELILEFAKRGSH